MKIKSNYRRASRRLSRRSSQEGMFFQQDTPESQAFFHPAATDPKAKAEAGNFFPKASEEEEPVKAKSPEEEEPAKAKEEEEPTAGISAKCNCGGSCASCSGGGERQEKRTNTSSVKAKEPHANPATKPAVIANRCSTQRRSVIDSAISHAQRLTHRAIDVVNQARTTFQEGSDATEKYETWFGPMDMARSQFVLDTFRSIQQSLASGSLIFQCDSRRKVYAFVDTNDGLLKVWLCNLFWTRAKSSGLDSRGGVLIHELSHEASQRIDDFVYGTKGALGISSPLEAFMAIRNADNYQFFAESL
jgi:hypothetical protein